MRTVLACLIVGFFGIHWDSCAAAAPRHPTPISQRKANLLAQKHANPPQSEPDHPAPSESPPIPQAPVAPLVIEIPPVVMTVPEIGIYQFQPEPETAPPAKAAPEWMANALPLAQLAFSGLLLLAVAFLVNLGRLQYRTYRGQSSVMRRQANIGSHLSDIAATQTAIASETLLATKATAEAARTQAEISRQFTSAVERPRLFPICTPNFATPLLNFSSNFISKDVLLHGMPSVTFDLQNYGRTPAILLSIRARVTGPAKVPASEEADYPLVELPGVRVIHPSERSEPRTVLLSDSSGAISREDYDDLAAGKKSWWFDGAVEFEDIWGDKNILHFSWRYDQGNRTFNPFPRERNYIVTLPVGDRGLPRPRTEQRVAMGDVGVSLR